MERYGMIYATDSLDEYSQVAVSDGIRDFVQDTTGVPFPTEALSRIQRTLRGGYVRLAGWDSQPQREKPLLVKYCPLMDQEAKQPLYALGISGVRMGYKAYPYDAMVLMGKKELLRPRGSNFLDHIFGTRMLQPRDLEKIQQKKGKQDLALGPDPVLKQCRTEDLPGVIHIIESLYAGNRVVIRLERGQVFNRRAMEVLCQVYALLPPQSAIGLGFAAYPDVEKLEELARDLDTKLFVIPGEQVSIHLPGGFVLVDMDAEHTLSKSNLTVCLRRWSDMKQEDRFEAMYQLFRAPGLELWSEEQFVAQTRKLFSDKIFRYKPTPGKCGTLEELKQEYDQFPALEGNIGCLREIFRQAVPVLLGGKDRLMELKIQAAIQARGEQDEAKRTRYAELYQFAQKLEPRDDTALTIRRTEAAGKQKMEAQRKELTQAHAAALAQVEQERSIALRAQEKAAAKKQEEALAAARKQAEEAAKKQKADLEEKQAKALAQKEKELRSQLEEAKKQAEQEFKKQKAAAEAAQAKAVEDQKRRDARDSAAAVKAAEQKRDEAAKKQQADLTARHEKAMAAKEAEWARKVSEAEKRAAAAEKKAAEAEKKAAASKPTVSAAPGKKGDTPEAEPEALKKLEEGYKVQLEAQRGRYVSQIEFLKQQIASLEKQGKQPGSGDGDLVKRLEQQLEQMRKDHAAQIERMEKNHAAELRRARAGVSAPAEQKSGEPTRQQIAENLMRSRMERERKKSKH